jgi:hypothetical protein
VTEKRVLGKEHPDTLNSISKLASTYMNHGRQMEAEELMIRVLDHIRMTSGEDHPLTVAIIAYLAVTRMYCEVSRLLSDMNRFVHGQCFHRSGGGPVWTGPVRV